MYSRLENLNVDTVRNLHFTRYVYSGLENLDVDTVRNLYFPRKQAGKIYMYNCTYLIVAVLRCRSRWNQNYFEDLELVTSYIAS